MTPEADFERLLDEWRPIASPGPNVEGWPQALHVLAQEEHRLRADGRWVHGRDDMFGVLGIERAEIHHSAMIAWLLDPCARHGLGTAFLGRVLRRCFPDAGFDDLAGARPTCEVTRGDSRADIVVWMSDATVIFENKVDADESPQQCDALFVLFRENIGARFVLLTPSGRRPDTASGEAAEAYVVLSFAEVRLALADSLRQPPAEASLSGRRVAEDYLRTLGREFR